MKTGPNDMLFELHRSVWVGSDSQCSPNDARCSFGLKVCLFFIFCVFYVLTNLFRCYLCYETTRRI